MMLSAGADACWKLPALPILQHHPGYRDIIVYLLIEVLGRVRNVSS